MRRGRFSGGDEAGEAREVARSARLGRVGGRGRRLLGLQPLLRLAQGNLEAARRSRRSTSRGSESATGAPRRRSSGIRLRMELLVDVCRDAHPDDAIHVAGPGAEGEAIQHVQGRARAPSAEKALRCGRDRENAEERGAAAQETPSARCRVSSDGLHSTRTRRSRITARREQGGGMPMLR